MATFFSSVRFGRMRCVVAILILRTPSYAKIAGRLSSSETESVVVIWKLVTHNVWKKTGENLEILIKL